ncbi:hypothetical protein EV193_1143 [Herbihabitans rhizosphaerae]|uniref:Uncharacterized protein n=1 Tax=Herbihabitans rhizosphaerae TaxID=1872711 RepID=A0A4Q7KDK3_9PSEU|nr:hypothetical protein [Herbihabitans rhizosphaerae]RZS31314.1 hypothetical protein EV193_1143 [Herbihabitans rhizosphaerae]
MARAALALPSTAGRDRLVAQGLVVEALVRLGRYADAVEPAVGALRWASGYLAAGGLTVSLARCARVLGAGPVGVELLSTLIEADGHAAGVRGVAIAELVGCLGHLGHRDEMHAALAEADRLCASDPSDSPSVRLLRRAWVAVRAAAYRRRCGRAAGAVRAARVGFGLLDELDHPSDDGGDTRARLSLELVQALLDCGEVSLGLHTAEAMFRTPVRATSATAVCHLMLAIATRVYMPQGRLAHARALLAEADRFADRFSLDAVRADVLTVIAQLDEDAGDTAAALRAVRQAHAVGRRHVEAATAARLLLAEEFGPGRSADVEVLLGAALYGGDRRSVAAQEPAPPAQPPPPTQPPPTQPPAQSSPQAQPPAQPPPAQRPALQRPAQRTQPPAQRPAPVAAQVPAPPSPAPVPLMPPADRARPAPSPVPPPRPSPRPRQAPEPPPAVEQPSRGVTPIRAAEPERVERPEPTRPEVKHPELSHLALAPPTVPLRIAEPPRIGLTPPEQVEPASPASRSGGGTGSEKPRETTGSVFAAALAETFAAAAARVPDDPPRRGPEARDTHEDDVHSDTDDDTDDDVDDMIDEVIIDDEVIAEVALTQELRVGPAASEPAEEPQPAEEEPPLGVSPGIPRWSAFELAMPEYPELDDYDDDDDGDEPEEHSDEHPDEHDVEPEDHAELPENDGDEWDEDFAAEGPPSTVDDLPPAIRSVSAWSATRQDTTRHDEPEPSTVVFDDTDDTDVVDDTDDAETGPMSMPGPRPHSAEESVVSLDATPRHGSDLGPEEGRSVLEQLGITAGSAGGGGRRRARWMPEPPAVTSAITDAPLQSVPPVPEPDEVPRAPEPDEVPAEPAPDAFPPPPGEPTPSEPDLPPDEPLIDEVDAPVQGPELPDDHLANSRRPGSRRKRPDVGLADLLTEAMAAYRSSTPSDIDTDGREPDRAPAESEPAPSHRWDF